jgi:hypothetical protein
VRKPEPIEWDEAAALAAAQMKGLAAPLATDGTPGGSVLPH